MGALDLIGFHSALRARGIRLPRTFDHSSMVLDGNTNAVMRRHHVPEHWGQPVSADAWFDRNGELKVCHCEYANGRSATVVRNARNWRVIMGPAIKAARTGAPA